MIQHCTPEALVDYVRGELPPDEDALLFTHVETCCDCREQYEIEKTLQHALREYGSATEREIPNGLRDAVFAAVRPVRTNPLQGLAALLRPRIAVPALGGAFSVALGLALFVHPAQPTQAVARTGIDAAAFFDRHSSAATAMPFGDHSNAPTFETASDTDDDGASAQAL